MYFFDAMHGWFGTNDGRVFRTTDGGNNWTGYESGNFSFVSGVQFVSPQVGIRISYTSPFITRSTDGGQTWATVANLPLSNIASMLSSTGVNTPSGSQIWVDGFTQTSGRYVLTSVDGGATWQQQVFPALPPGHLPYLSATSFGALNDSVRAFGATINVTTYARGGEILSYRQRIGLVTGAYENAGLPNDYSLSQNYPNPFNPTTTIRFVVGMYGHTSLRVYDVLGHEVATLVNEEKPAGSYSVSWNATGMASGVYFYRLSAGQFSAIKKLLLLH
jgi:hypothetical protein